MERNSRNKLPIQFRLSVVLWGTVTIAVVCALLRWYGQIPFRSILPGGLLLAACCAARRWPDTAWGLFSMAWLMAVWQTADELYQQLAMIHCHGVQPEPFRAELLSIYVAALSVPALLSLPVAYWLWRLTMGRVRFVGWRWVGVAIWCGFADVSLLMALAWFVADKWVGGLNWGTGWH